MKRLGIAALCLLLLCACAFAEVINPEADYLYAPQGAMVPLYKVPGGEQVGEYYSGQHVGRLFYKDNWAQVTIGSLQGGSIVGYINRANLPGMTPLETLLLPAAVVLEDTEVLDYAQDGSAAIGQLYKGTIVEVMGTAYGFVHIRLADRWGDFGWMDDSVNLTGFVAPEALETTNISFYNRVANRMGYQAQGFAAVKEPSTEPDSGSVFVPAFTVPVAGAQQWALHFDQDRMLPLVADLGDFVQSDFCFIEKSALECYWLDTPALAENLPAGTYSDLCGFYTFHAAADDPKGYSISLNGKTETHAVLGGGEYSFYLPQGAVLTTGQGTLTNLTDAMPVADPVGRFEGDEQYRTTGGRILLGHHTAGMDGTLGITTDGTMQGAYYVLRTVQEDGTLSGGTQYPIKPDQSIDLSITSTYGVFVEFYNCIVYHYCSKG